VAVVNTTVEVEATARNMMTDGIVLLLCFEVMIAERLFCCFVLAFCSVGVRLRSQLRFTKFYCP
jgi:hypothetical protein